MVLFLIFLLLVSAASSPPLRMASEGSVTDTGFREWEPNRDFASEPYLWLRPGHDIIYISSELPMQSIEFGFADRTNPQDITVEAVRLSGALPIGSTYNDWMGYVEDIQLEVLDSVEVSDTSLRYHLNLRGFMDVLLRAVGPSVSYKFISLDAETGFPIIYVNVATPTTLMPPATATPTSIPESPLLITVEDYNCRLSVEVYSDESFYITIKCDKDDA